MFDTLKEAFKTKSVRNKIFLTLFILVIYRLGCFIPLPGIDVKVFTEGVTADNGFLSILSSISGGALANGSLLALGVGPYINASIIIQLLTFIIPPLQNLAKEGDQGRKKINFFTRLAALGMGLAQSIAIVIAFNKSGALYTGIFKGAPTWITSCLVVAILVAGGMFTLWLGEKITEIGVGNGLSLILFVGILSTAGTSILKSIQNAIANPVYIWTLILFAFAVVAIFGLIIWIDLAERKVPVQYANQMRGRKMYGGQSTHIPMKINGSGVMPIIFTMMFVAFPQIILSFWPTSSAYIWYSKVFGAGSWVYIVVTSILILAFAFFYAKLQFNPEDVSNRLQQNGGFIPGIRPGKNTTEYLGRISNRITLFGAIFLAFIALVPSLVFKGVGGDSLLINAFSATGLLIVVSVALEFDKQLQTQLLMKNYRSLLK